MNSVLKSYFTAAVNPSWEDGRSGTVLVYYVDYISRDGEKSSEWFKRKNYSSSSFEKIRDAYGDIRLFLEEKDSLVAGVLRRHKGYKIIIDHLSLVYRLAAEHDKQYVDTMRIEYDARRKPDDRLASCKLTMSLGDSHE